MLDKEEAVQDGAPHLDPHAELTAMTAVAEALRGLPSDAIGRILQWVANFYQVEVVRPKPPSGGTSSVARESNEPIQPAASNKAAYETLADLFDLANAQTAPDKALVVGYWMQVVQGQDDLDGFYINKELRHLGHESTNITRDMDSLIAKRLVIQTRKIGNTKQARKKYKLTREGMKLVERMVEGIDSEF